MSPWIRFVVATLLLLIPTAAWSQSAPADTLLDQIIARGTLRVGSTGDYKPFTFLNPETKEFVGIDIDMAASLAKAMGVKLEIVKTSWPTLLPDLLAGKYDMAMGGVSVSLERQKKALFTIPYMVDGKTAISRCADKDKYGTLADIDKSGVRVITNPGGTNEKFDRDHLKEAAITVYNDNVTIFDQIVADKADVMITDTSETLLQQKLHPELCSLHPDHPFNFSEKAYMVARDFALKAFADQWLHQAIETKEYQAITDKHLK
ncbi:MAG: transporter substrate-binding domain-containing protein [Alphaproteobacteria bacterium]|nr:transporter substrate-binding domain-containing protein [Alphaproteobacteria bacterium]